MLDQILTANWVFIGFVATTAILAHFVSTITVRRLRLSWLADTAVWLAALWPIYFCLTAMLGPSLYGWQARIHAEKILAETPFYRVLIEHDPAARQDLLKAMSKIPRSSNQSVGMLELGAVVDDALRRYIPVASDHSVTDFVGKLLFVMAEMRQREPERCIWLVDDPLKVGKAGVALS